MLSQVGKTILKGHGLRYEGRVIYNERGVMAPEWPPRKERLHAKCSCGALSPAGISMTAAKQWHREHKDSLR